MGLRENRLWNWRVVLVCYSALAISLPIAWISLAKLGLLLGSLWLLVRWAKAERVVAGPGSRVVQVVPAVVGAMSLGILWTTAPLDVALLAYVKHAKLLLIPAIVLLVRSKEEALLALKAFGLGQLFLLGSSLLLAFGVPVPWTTDPIGNNVVFSTYLDQSIMFCVAAGIFWHLRREGIWPLPLAGAAALGCLFATLFLLYGRTGYLAALVCLVLIVFWETPTQYRLPLVLALPVLLAVLFAILPTQTQDRILVAYKETRQYSQRVEAESSSGWRLNAWNRSLQAIAEKPIIGHGTGSWATTVKRIEGEAGTKIFGKGDASNPHQEFLLWTVELGMLGVLALGAIGYALMADALRFSVPVQRATLATLAILVTACMFNSALYDDLIGDYLCITMGLMVAFGRYTRNPAPL